MTTTRFLFILFLLLNFLFLAALRGWFGLGPSEEPGRVSIELHPEYIKVLGPTPPPEIVQIISTQDAPPPNESEQAVCLVWSGLSPAQNNKLISLFSAANIQTTTRDVQVASSWRVRVPPLPTREAAEILADNMTELGVEKDDIHIEEAGGGKFAIVLGSPFRNRQSAERYLETVKSKGINASIDTRNTPERRIESTVTISQAETLLAGQPFARRHRRCTP
ncbi:MAG: hypothetical protein LBV29_02680 [Azoarcus sp.]|jgi:hypothetical protein|nr:hypothetical protein [Azoarcus sp.]